MLAFSLNNIINTMVIVCPLFFIGVIFGIVPLLISKKSRQDNFKKKFYPQLIEKVFPKTRFIPDQSLKLRNANTTKEHDSNSLQEDTSVDAMKNSLTTSIFNEWTDSVNGRNLFVGELTNGTSFKYTEVTLLTPSNKMLAAEIAATVLTRENQIDEKHEGVLFDGAIIQFRIPRSAEVELKIHSKSCKYKNALAADSHNKFETESVQFNKIYDVYCTDIAKAYYILTPQFMEKLTNFYNYYGDCMIYIVGDQLTFALPKFTLFDAPQKNDKESADSAIRSSVNKFNNLIEISNILTANNQSCSYFSYSDDLLNDFKKQRISPLIIIAAITGWGLVALSIFILFNF